MVRCDLTRAIERIATGTDDRVSSYLSMNNILYQSIELTVRVYIKLNKRAAKLHWPPKVDLSVIVIIIYRYR